MIALQDDFDQIEVGSKKSTIRTSGTMQTLLQKLQGSFNNRKQRKTDQLALNQLMQLDDALLKDMGISRTDLHAVKTGDLSFDALIKHEITSARDNASYVQSPAQVLRK